MMLGVRRVSAVIPKINFAATVDVRFLSTPAPSTSSRKNKLFETEKVVKYVHVPQPSPLQKRTGNTDVKEGNEAYELNPVGRFYQEVVHKGRLGKKIGLGDVRRMFMMCEKPEDVRYASGLVQLLQTKGEDFSEGVNLEYVKACIRMNKIDVLIKDFSLYQNRIGAWTTDASFQLIVQALATTHTASKALPVLHTLATKGVVMKESTVAMLVRACAYDGDQNEYDRVRVSALKVASAESVDRMFLKYPLKDPPVEGEVVAEVEVEVVEGESAVPPSA